MIYFCNFFIYYYYYYCHAYETKRFLEECNPGFWGLFGGKSSGNFDVIGLIIWMLCVLYSSLRSASKSSKITMSENMLIKDNGAGETLIIYFYLYKRKIW